MKKPPPKDTRRLAWAIAGLLIILTTAAYSRIGALDFVSLDDPAYVTRNPHVMRGLTVESFLWSLRAFHSANWHPLTWLSHMLDVQLFDMRPLGHHLTSLVLHLVNVMLLFLFVNRLSGNVWRSGFVAALFGVHPLHVESVAWVAERKDVLSTLFLFLTLLAHVSYVRRPSAFRYVLAVLLLALGLTAKPMLVTAPILMLLVDYWPLGRGFNWKLVREKIPFFALAAGSIVITLAAQSGGGAVRTLEQYSLGVRIANAFAAYAGYIVKTVYPARLCALYVHPTTTIPVWQVVASAAALILITFAAVRAAKRRPYFLVGWLWYVIALIPVIGLVQVGEQAMADRYTYIPLIGLFVVAAWGAPDLLRRLEPARRRAACLGVLAALVLIVMSALTWAQVGTWRTGVTLFRNVLRVFPNHNLSHYCLADAYMEENRIAHSLKHYRIALRLNPKHTSSKAGIALALMKIGRRNQAWRLFNEVVKSDPTIAPAWSYLGEILILKGDFSKSLPYFRKALQLEPDYAVAHFNLGTALYRLGDMKGARRHYESAVRFNPTFAAALCSLGAVMFREGNLTEAEQHLRQALRIRPTLVEAHLGLGQVLVRTHHFDEAVQHLRIAVEKRPRWAIAHYNLAIALYGLGEFEESLREALKAQSLGWKVDPEFLDALHKRAAPR